MTKNRFSVVLCAGVLATSFSVFAQNTPQRTTTDVAKPGEAKLGDSVQLQGKVKSIDTKKRIVTVVGPRGYEVVFNLGEDVRNIEQLKVGDVVTLNYSQAVAVKLRKVPSTGIRERDESMSTVRSEPGQKPGGSIEKTVRMIADVVAINPRAQTVTLRGAQHTVDLVVRDPAQLKEMKVGNQVEAVYVEAVAIQVTPAKK
ncbi:hypothetical protein EKL30_03280 [Candidimonas sp. SYP-B2681]|uniref:hypothetical protein n=1 Tax=Candidimonas sp. SYP-B2681 TaxID=2497686 RepID=UPI000F85EBA2|nr:hypothetical protein [Candidimonas sp. SYP-B2681]RTZ48011.1 hypothetical protein EKL30_03280 [Candidimonas sp. SYP-B2681]